MMLLHQLAPFDGGLSEVSLLDATHGYLVDVVTNAVVFVVIVGDELDRVVIPGETEVSGMLVCISMIQECNEQDSISEDRFGVHHFSSDVYRLAIWKISSPELWNVFTVYFLL